MNMISELKARIKIQCLSLIFITGTLIILFTIVGCSDTSTPYTGTMPTSIDVSDYAISNTGGLYCIYNDTGSSCIDLIPLISTGSVDEGPIVHIYPERTLYLFYYEGKPIIRAERVGDTTELVKTLVDRDGDLPNEKPTSPGGAGNNPNNNNESDGGDSNNNNPNGNGDSDGGDSNDNNPNENNDIDDDSTGDNTDAEEEDSSDNTGRTDNRRDGFGWLIWIYYPEGTLPIDSPTLSESEVTISINGKQLSDDDITGFAKFIESNGETGIQFYYPTESAELFDLNLQIEGVSYSNGEVKFNINYLWRSD
ncbi:hypothetical protein C6497_07875 [Candidatus Poribacteria bacterium]|nr:MAG: hypothetical protein C6497_07875 [Candidatus Poribacteria bacterium]